MRGTWLKPIVILLTVLLSLVVSSAPASAATLNPRKVLVVLSSDNAIYLAAHQAILSQAYSDQLEFSQLILSPAPHAENKLQVKPGEFDLLVTIGSEASEQLVTQQQNTPVLSILLPKVKLQALLESAPAEQWAGIYIDQPPQRQFALARRLFPTSSKAGTLIPADEQASSAGLRALAGDYQYSLDVRSGGTGRETIRSIKELLADSQLLTLFSNSATLDPQTAKWLLYMSYREATPVIAFSRSYVKAGALAAVYSTPAQIGQQAAEIVNDWASSGRLPSNTIQPSKYFSVEVNQGVARSLGLSSLYDLDSDELAAKLQQQESYD